MSDSKGGGFMSGLRDKFEKSSLHEKYKDSPLHDAKVKASHMKSSMGKFANVINPNHRHDEEHEQRTDAKRESVAQGHRFHSFAPERMGNKIKWYIDARDYFHVSIFLAQRTTETADALCLKAVSIALDRAKETIYLEDWWLSPELVRPHKIMTGFQPLISQFLRRPPSKSQHWRLDQVLKRRAEAGVQIYIIVYKEVRVFILIHSQN